MNSDNIEDFATANDVDDELTNQPESSPHDASVELANESHEPDDNIPEVRDIEKPVKKETRQRLANSDSKKMIFTAAIVIILMFSSFYAGMNFNNPEQPSGEVDEGMIASDGVSVISENTRLPEDNENLASTTVNNESIVYTYNGDPGELEYKEGDIIVGTVGEGYLRKVSSIEEDGNQVTVNTELATLDEVLLDAEINYTKEDLFPVEDGGTRADGKISFSGSLTIPGDLINKPFDVVITISASVQKTSSSTSFVARYSNGLQYMEYIITETYVIDYGIGISGQMDIASLKQIMVKNKLADASEFVFWEMKTHSSFWTTVGIPICWTPYAWIEWDLKVSLSAALNYGGKITTVKSTGYRYTPANGFQPYSTQENDPEMDEPSISIGWGVEAKWSLYLHYEIRAYGTIGLFIEVGPYLKFKYNSMDNPSWGLYFGIELKLGLRLFVGVEETFNFWGWSYTVSITLVDLRWELVLFDAAVTLFESPYETPPSAPRNLQISPYQDRALLTWEPPESDGNSPLTFPWASYHVYRSVNGGAYSEIGTVQPDIWGNCDCQYIDTGIHARNAYSYKVGANNYRGLGETSAVRTLEYLGSSAFLAGNLRTEVGYGYTYLSWDEPQQNTGYPWTNYTVLRSDVPFTDSYPAGFDGITVQTSNNHLNITGLTNGQEYHYMVIANNAYSNFWDAGAQISAMPMAPPTSPLNVTTGPGDNQVNISWETPEDNGGFPVTHYRIYRDNVQIAEIGPVHYYIDIAPVNGMEYNYSVSAMNPAGEGQKSEDISATPRDVPTAPRNLGATFGNGSTSLVWQAPSDNGGFAVTNYTIYRGTSAGAETFLVLLGNVLNYTDTGLLNGETYYYTISATNIVGEGGQSNEVYNTPMTVPTAPEGLNASAGNGYVNLAWTEPASNGGTPITGYRIYRLRITSVWGLIGMVGAVLTYNDTNVANGQVYTYKVLAFNIVGQSVYSNEASDAPGTVPDAPLYLDSDWDDEIIQLSWQAPYYDGGFAVSNYNIYRGTSSGTETFLAQIGNLRAYDDLTVVNGQIYYYYVTAVNSEGESLASNEVSDTPLGLPSAPLNPTTFIGDNFINLTWQEPADLGGLPVLNYKIYRGTTPGGEALIANIGNILYYKNTGVINGQTYYYKVSARNDMGESLLSSEASGVPEDEPTAPRYFAAIAGNEYVNLSWDAPSDNGGFPVTGYRIYRSNSSGTETFLMQIGPVTAYNDLGLTNGQIYYYRVSALNIVGESPLSLEKSATPRSVPSIPLNLTANSGDGFVNLNWEAPADIGGSPVTYYEVHRGTSPGSETYFTQTGNVTAYNNTGLVNGETYYYKVCAINGVGVGPLSNEVNGTPHAVPGVPRSLAAVASNGGANLTWLAPLTNGGFPVLNYSIYRGTTPGGEVFLAQTGAVTYFADAGLTNGQIYYYMVTATNIIGEGQLSAEASCIPKTIPGSPQSLTSVSGAGYVRLSWLAGSNGGGTISNYRIYRGTSPGNESFLTQIGNVLTYNNTGLINGQTYYYKVLAVNEIGLGPLSDETSDTPLSVPASPTSLVASYGYGFVNLTWLAPVDVGGSPLTNYRIYRSTGSGTEVFLTEISTVLFFNDTGLTNGITYYYKVSARNAVGEGPLSAEKFETPRALPTAPQTLSAVTGDEFVNITWAGPADLGGFPVLNYRIYRGTSPGSESFYTQIGNLTYFNDTTVNGWTTYYYTVAAVTGVGEGPSSNEANGSPDSTPDGPQGITVVTGNCFVNLTWTEPSDGGYPITNYTVYKGTDTGTETYLATLGDQLYYNDTAVIGYVEYYYIITATNVLGQGANSSEVNGMPVSVPYAPQNLTASENGFEIELNWDQPMYLMIPVFTYRIYRGTASGTLSYLDQVSSPTTTFTDMGPSNNVTYFYAVTAVNGIGEGPESNEVNETVTAPPGPISINGDLDFAAQTSSEGWLGDGTPGNPYIIEGLFLDSSTSDGITISNTNVSFVIANVTIFGMQSFMGINLLNVKNGTIYNCTLDNNFAGMIIDSCTNMNITECTITNNTMEGIVMMMSDSNHITDNTISNSDTGIVLDSSNSNYLLFNNISNNTNGVKLQSGSTLNTLFGNNFVMNMIHADDSGIVNAWDDGMYGNYWDDYFDVDIAPTDGVWDNPYMIMGTAGAMDSFAMVAPFI